MEKTNKESIYCPFCEEVVELTHNNKCEYCNAPKYSILDAVNENNDDNDDINILSDLEMRDYIEGKICPNCNINKATEPHACPFKEDVNNDTKTLCICCSECEYECEMDI